MRIFLIIALLLAVTLPTSAQDLSADYLQMIEKADSLIQHSKWREAEECFMTAMRRHPANPMNVLVMSNVGLLRHYDGRDADALEILNQAVEMAPASVTVRANRAKVHTSMGNAREALDDYNTVLATDSLLLEPRQMRCLLSLHQGDLAAAVADADFLERHYPNDAATAEAKAYTLIADAQYARAIPYLNKLIKHSPTASNYGERALCNIMIDDLNAASADINDAIRRDPLNGEFYLYRAILNKRRYRQRDSAEDVQKAISLGVDEKKIRLFGL